MKRCRLLETREGIGIVRTPTDDDVLPPSACLLTDNPQDRESALHDLIARRRFGLPLAVELDRAVRRGFVDTGFADYLAPERTLHHALQVRR